MDNAFDRHMPVIADRIGRFLGTMIEFGIARDELPGDRIGRIGRIDQRRHGGSNGDGIAGGDSLQLGQPLRRHQTSPDQLRRLAEDGRADRLRGNGAHDGTGL
ncbi:MAG: hypothetical protein WDN69_30385 [Aliidongia sp.]